MRRQTCQHGRNPLADHNGGADDLLGAASDVEHVLQIIDQLAVAFSCEQLQSTTTRLVLAVAEIAVDEQEADELPPAVTDLERVRRAIRATRRSRELRRLKRHHAILGMLERLHEEPW